MPENPYDSPQEVNDWARRPYKFQWWPAASLAPLVFAAIGGFAEAWTEGRSSRGSGGRFQPTAEAVGFGGMIAKPRQGH
jgi:hypothetical protein